MLENTTQIYNLKDSTKNPLKCGMAVLFNNFKKMEFNPLYWFTLPGLFFCSCGLYVGLYLLRISYLGGRLPFGPTVLMVLLTVVGIGLAFTGILLHSISGLFRRLA